MLLYWVLRYVFPGPFVWILFRLHAEGAGHVPVQGPLILACDHLSLVDPILVQLAVRRRVAFVAKQEYFTRRGLLGFVVRWFFMATGMIPMDRSGGPAAEEAIAAATVALVHGRVVGIFPEGTRSPDGRLYRGRTGVGRLVVASRAPVVPVAVIGTDRILPPGKWLPRFGQATIRFGRPMEFVDSSSRAITNEVMRAVQQLSGRPYVDAYAPLRSRGNWDKRLEDESC